MKIGRKSKNWAAAGRRLFAEGETRNGSGNAAVAMAEREALLSPDHEEASMDAAQDTETLIAGDPTQRLLTALGRFQRQVAKAESGAPQGAWTDECMAQLITGVEIALGQGWKDVQRALTETARILQSYENAGRAPECRRFLQDSYEILCLMVGDLIVDNVRSGVLRKWNDCYERAVADLGKAGLRLVEDDVAEDEEAFQIRDTESPFSLPEEDAGQETGEEFDRVLEADDSMDNSEAPMLDAAEGCVETAETEREAHVAGPDMFWQKESSRDIEDSDAGLIEGEPSEPDMEPQDDGSPDEPESPGASDSDDSEEEEILEEHPAGEAAMEAEPTGEYDAPDTTAEAELADAAEASTEVTPEERSDSPASSPDRGLAPEDNLMQEARSAMARGDVKQAKQLALQLAVDMARLEAESARKELESAELLLRESQSGIEAAELDVAMAEQDLDQLQRSQEEQNAEHERQHEEIEDLRGSIALIEGAIADLEAQMRALEEKRNAERERMTGVHRALEEALAGERQIQQALDALSEAEAGSRRNLEDARRRVSDLREAHRGEEAQLEFRRQQLEERNRAAADIERLLGPVSPASSQDDLLF